MPVYLGGTVTARCEFTAIDVTARRSSADIAITDQDGELVCVGQHILKWVPNEP